MNLKLSIQSPVCVCVCDCPGKGGSFINMLQWKKPPVSKTEEDVNVPNLLSEQIQLAQVLYHCCDAKQYMTTVYNYKVINVIIYIMEPAHILSHGNHSHCLQT